jgi:hypothetical protein
MEIGELFLATLNELENYLAVGDDYSMLRASALLRQMLMDGSPLIHQVNRVYRLQISFPVCGFKYRETALSMAPDFYSAIGGIHSSGSLSHQMQFSRTDDFLNTKVVKLGAELLSVGDLISISANVLGGVHAGQPRTEKEEALASFDRRVRFGSQSLNAAQMRPIILVALDGLKTLRDTVKNAKQ